MVLGIVLGSIFHRRYINSLQGDSSPNPGLFNDALACTPITSTRYTSSDNEANVIVISSPTCNFEEINDQNIKLLNLSEYLQLHCYQKIEQYLELILPQPEDRIKINTYYKRAPSSDLSIYSPLLKNPAPWTEQSELYDLIPGEDGTQYIMEDVQTIICLEEEIGTLPPEPPK